MKKLIATFAVAMAFSMPAMATTYWYNGTDGETTDLQNLLDDDGVTLQEGDYVIWKDMGEETVYDHTLSEPLGTIITTDFSMTDDNPYDEGYVTVTNIELIVLQNNSKSIHARDLYQQAINETNANRKQVIAAYAWKFDNEQFDSLDGKKETPPKWQPTSPIHTISTSKPPKKIQGGRPDSIMTQGDFTYTEVINYYITNIMPEDQSDFSAYDGMSFTYGGKDYIFNSPKTYDVTAENIAESMNAFENDTIRYTHTDGTVVIISYSDSTSSWGAEFVSPEQPPTPVPPGTPDTISVSTVDFDPDTTWGEALKGFNPAFPATSTVGPYSFDEAYQKVLRHKYWAKQKDRDLIWYSSYNEATKRLAEDQTNVKSKGTRFSINGEWYNLTKESGRLAFLKQSTKGIETDAGMIAKIKNQKYVFSGDTWRNVNSKVKKSFDYGDALDIQDAAIAIGYATLEYNEPTWWGSNGTLKFTGNGLDSMNFVTMDSRQLKNAITDIVNETYKDGYDDGYEDGFADGHKIGYDKGWHDAKADNAYNN